MKIETFNKKQVAGVSIIVDLPVNLRKVSDFEEQLSDVILKCMERGDIGVLLNVVDTMYLVQFEQSTYDYIVSQVVAYLNSRRNKLAVKSTVKSLDMVVSSLKGPEIPEI